MPLPMPMPMPGTSFNSPSTRNSSMGEPGGEYPGSTMVQGYAPTLASLDRGPSLNSGHLFTPSETSFMTTTSVVTGTTNDFGTRHPSVADDFTSMSTSVFDEFGNGPPSGGFATFPVKGARPRNDDSRLLNENRFSRASGLIPSPVGPPSHRASTLGSYGPGHAKQASTSSLGSAQALLEQLPVPPATIPQPLTEESNTALKHTIERYEQVRWVFRQEDARSQSTVQMRKVDQEIINALTRSLADVQVELSEAYGELQEGHRHLVNTEEALDQCRQEVHEKRRDLVDLQSQLQEVISAKQAEKHAASVQISEYCAHILQMEQEDENVKEENRQLVTVSVKISQCLRKQSDLLLRLRLRLQ
jgi:hypothetical protein